MADLLQLSDLHIGKSAEVTARARHCLAEVRRRWQSINEKPLLVITGDITDDGLDEQIGIAADEFRKMREAGFEVMVLPGNHDYGSGGTLADPARFRSFCEKVYLSPVVEFPVRRDHSDFVVLGLDSMQAECGPIDGWLADGELGPAQRNRLDAQLTALQEERRQGKRVVVALHHHPFIFNTKNPLLLLIDWFGHSLKDGRALRQVLRGRVDALLFGHEHVQRNFSSPKEKMAKKLQIPVVLSSGSSSACGHRDPIGRGWLLRSTTTTVDIESLVF